MVSVNTQYQWEITALQCNFLGNFIPFTEVKECLLYLKAGTASHINQMNRVLEKF